MSHCSPSATFTASSNLPISAGLGSSAAYSSCIATSLLLAHNHLSLPTPAASSSKTQPSLSGRDTDLIDGWAFLAEKVLHGNPSGIDNAVSVRGGAVTFARSVGGKKGGIEGLHGYAQSRVYSSMLMMHRFSSIRLLLTNTLVPRDTKSLVAGVSARRQAEPQVVNPILDSIQSISDEAKALLSGAAPVDRQHLLSRLEVSPSWITFCKWCD